MTVPDRAGRTGDLPWVDALKGLAIVWIVLNHVTERLVGGAYAGNLAVPWATLGERFAQFAPVGHGIAGGVLTALRDLGWFGDQGVTLFLILSGFGITHGLLLRDAPGRLVIGPFYVRRGRRVLPMWWAAHVLFLPLGFFLGGFTTGDWQFYASFFGLRFVPGAFYYFSPAWWYVGLILQLYLVYPLLWRLLAARGATVTLVACCVTGFAATTAGPFLFHDSYLDAWNRGAFFVTRLPSFGFGIALAAWWVADRERVRRRLRSPGIWIAALAAYALATWLSFFVRGEIVATAILGIAAFAVLFPLVDRCRSGGLLARLGRESYAIYLVHDPLVTLFVRGGRPGHPRALAFVVAGILVALIATACASWLLVSVTDVALASFGRLAAARGTRGAVAIAATGFAAIVAVPIAADAAVLAWDPQEVQGWGERLSLEPSARFGWKMVPNQTTRLRWHSYDYVVRANALGFPGPLYADRKPAGTYRVLVTGDAFTSAEGVDTDRSWPRVMQSALERDFARAGHPRHVQVLDFAITGYGPEQEAAVLSAFVPRFDPDAVVLEEFANDVGDALESDDAFRASIGFAKPSPVGLVSIVGLYQLEAFIADDIRGPLIAAIFRKPDPDGYFLGNFTYLARADRTRYDAEGIRRSIADEARMAAVARRTGAHFLVAFVPAPVEVCGRASLRYYPRHVSLADSERYERYLPDERAQRIATAAGVTLDDLRPMLDGARPCPYMANNMHFTVAGNAGVAAAIARRLVDAP